MGSRGTNGWILNRNAMGLAALGAGALLLAACLTSGPEGGWKPAPYSPPPPPEDDSMAFGDDDDDDMEAALAETTATPPASAAPTAAPVDLRADGAACSKGAECQSGICEGQGCEADQGKCAPKERECTGAKQQLCDCSSQTITVEKASCPGVTYKYPGPCK